MGEDIELRCGEEGAVGIAPIGWHRLAEAVSEGVSGQIGVGKAVTAGCDTAGEADGVGGFGGRIGQRGAQNGTRERDRERQEGV